MEIITIKGLHLIVFMSIDHFKDFTQTILAHFANMIHATD